MKLNILVCILFSIIFSSCEKESVGCGFGAFDSISFGHFYGECAGEGCVEIFKIDYINQKLYEDVNDEYPDGNDYYNGLYTNTHVDEKFQLVKDLKDLFPHALLTETETVLGQPDAGDWGGIYVEYNSGSVHRFWLLDQMESNMPQQYNEFVDKINERIEIINQ